MPFILTKIKYNKNNNNNNDNNNNYNNNNDDDNNNKNNKNNLVRKAFNLPYSQLSSQRHKVVSMS